MEDLSIGSGILLGLLAFSFVFLIVKTKDRWKWGRIFAVIIGLPVLAILVSVGIQYYKYMPKRTLDFAGLTLNMPVKEVLFLKGEPKSEIESLSKIDRLLVYPIGDYGNAELVVSCDAQKVVAIEICGDSNFSLPIYGLFLGSEYEAVIDKLGESYQVKEHSEFYRSLYFKEFNVIIGVRQGEVAHLGIVVDPDQYGWLSFDPKK